MPGSHSFLFELSLPASSLRAGAGFVLLSQFGAFSAKCLVSGGDESQVEKVCKCRSRAGQPKFSVPALRHPRYLTLGFGPGATPVLAPVSGSSVHSTQRRVGLGVSL